MKNQKTPFSCFKGIFVSRKNQHVINGMLEDCKTFNKLNDFNKILSSKGSLTFM